MSHSAAAGREMTGSRRPGREGSNLVLVWVSFFLGGGVVIIVVCFWFLF